MCFIYALEGFQELPASRARSAGIEEIYLVTKTAQNYFIKKGYSDIVRESVPEEVKRSSEFSHVCPVSAVVMKKQLI